MGVTVARTYKLSTNGGQVIYMTEAEAQTLQVEETRATLVCDSPKCAVRHNTENPTTASWVEEDCQKDPTKVPENINKFLAFGQGKVACSAQCLKDYLTYSYKEPPSPKELRAQMEAAKKEQTEKLAELNPHLIKPETKVDGHLEPPPVRLVDVTADESVVQNCTTEYHVSEVPATLPPHCGDTLKVVSTPAIEVAALCQEAVPDSTGFSE